MEGSSPLLSIPIYHVSGGVFHGHVPLPHSPHAAGPRSHPPRGLEGHPVLSHPPVPPPAVFQGEVLGAGVLREGSGLSQGVEGGGLPGEKKGNG